MLQAVWQPDQALGTEQDRSDAVHATQRVPSCSCSPTRPGCDATRRAGRDRQGGPTRKVLDGGALEDAYVLRIGGKARRRAAAASEADLDLDVGPPDRPPLACGARRIPRCASGRSVRVAAAPSVYSKREPPRRTPRNIS